MGPVTIAILIPKAPLTDHHKKVIGDEVKSALQSAESVTLRIPVIGEDPVPGYIRSLCRNEKYVGRLCYTTHYYDRHYAVSLIVDWAAEADRIIACPSRMSCGRIVDRVWGPVGDLRRRGRNVVVALPKALPQ